MELGEGRSWVGRCYVKVWVVPTGNGFLGASQYLDGVDRGAGQVEFCLGCWYHDWNRYVDMGMKFSE